MSNDDDTELFHTVRECTYNGSDLVQFTFPSLLYTDKDWVIFELTFDEITWTRALTNRLAITKQVELTRTWPSHVYLNELNTEIYIQAGELNSATKGGDFWNMELFDNMQCKFISVNDGD